MLLPARPELLCPLVYRRGGDSAGGLGPDKRWAKQSSAIRMWV